MIVAFFTVFKNQIVWINMKTGEFIKNSIFNKSEMSGQIADILLMQAGDNYAAYDLNDLSYKEYKARKGATTWLEREDAKYLYVYEKKRVTKLKTR